MLIINQIIKHIINYKLTNPLEYKELIELVTKIDPFQSIPNTIILLIYKDYIEKRTKKLSFTYTNKLINPEIQISLYYSLKSEPTIVQQLNHISIPAPNDIKDLHKLIVNHPKIKIVYDSDEVFRRVIDMFREE